MKNTLNYSSRRKLFFGSFVVHDRVGAAIEVHSAIQSAGIEVINSECQPQLGDWHVGSLFLYGEPQTMSRVQKEIETRHPDFHFSVRALHEPLPAVAPYAIQPVTLFSIELEGNTEVGLFEFLRVASEHRASLHHLIFTTADEDEQNLYRVRAQVIVLERREKIVLEEMFLKPLPPSWHGQLETGWKSSGSNRHAEAWARVFPGPRFEVLPDDFDTLSGPATKAA